MLEQRRLIVRIVVERHLLVEDRKIAGLFDVCGYAQDQPQRVVVEAAADVVVTALRQRLVLVVSAAVGELSGRDVDDALAGTFRDLMDEAEQILVRVPEAHASPDTGLEVRCTARHVERDHALVGVPDVDHAVELLVRRLDLVHPEQAVPVLTQLGEGFLHFRVAIEVRDHGVGALLVDDARGLELFRHGVLDVAQHERERLRLSRC